MALKSLIGLRGAEPNYPLLAILSAIALGFIRVAGLVRRELLIALGIFLITGNISLSDLILISTNMYSILPADYLQTKWPSFSKFNTQYVSQLKTKQLFLILMSQSRNRIGNILNRVQKQSPGSEILRISIILHYNHLAWKITVNLR